MNIISFFVPKYRRKVIFGQLKKDIGEIIRKLCNEKKVEIIEAEACLDHIHMLVKPVLSIAVVDDDERLLDELQHYIHRYAREHNDEFTVSIYSDALDLLKCCEMPDIVFMDVEMPNLSGLEAAKEIRKTDESCVIVFIT